MVSNRAPQTDSHLFEQQAYEYGRRIAADEYSAASDRVEGARGAWTEGNGDWTTWWANVLSHGAIGEAHGTECYDAHREDRENGTLSECDCDCPVCHDADELARIADDAASELWTALVDLPESARAHVENRIGEDPLLVIVEGFRDTELALTLGDEYGDPDGAVVDAITRRLVEHVTDELYRKETGHVSGITLAPAGELEAQAAVVEIVVLSPDGATLAYRLSDHGHDAEWALGTIEDACGEAIARLERLLDAEAVR